MCSVVVLGCCYALSLTNKSELLPSDHSLGVFDCCSLVKRA